MRVLVVHAHPDSNSYNASLCQTAVSALRESGHHVDLVDLYAEEFEPRLSAAEREVYETASPILDPQVRRYADLVLQAQALIFIYPTWWWGMPAMLKGWLERVMVTGVSFQLDPVTNEVKPSLGHVRRVIGITTYGSTRASMRVFNDGGRRLVMRCVRVLCPKLTCRGRWFGLYNMDHCTDADRATFVRRIDKAMRSL